MRGGIKISLSQTTFSPGEIILGYFELKIRKRIEGQKLYAALIGEEVTEEPGRDQSNRNVTRREIYRDELMLELEQLYEAGNTRRYDFLISTQSLQDIAGESGSSDSLLGQVLKTGFDAAGELGLLAKHYLEWKVEVKLVAKGIDLVSSKKVTINLLNSDGTLFLTPGDFFK